jgi:hypothetical protein
MKIITLVVFILTLTACAYSSEKMVLPNGEQGVSIRCEEYLEYCYKEAGKSCPNGCDIKDKTTSSNFLVPVYNLLIACK